LGGARHMVGCLGRYGLAANEYLLLNSGISKRPPKTLHLGWWTYGYCTAGLWLLLPRSEELRDALPFTRLPPQLHLADVDRLVVESSQHGELQTDSKHEACWWVYQEKDRNVLGGQQISRIWATSRDARESGHTPLPPYDLWIVCEGCHTLSRIVVTRHDVPGVPIAGPSTRLREACQSAAPALAAPLCSVCTSPSRERLSSQHHVNNACQQAMKRHPSNRCDDAMQAGRPTND